MMTKNKKNIILNEETRSLTSGAIFKKNLKFKSKEKKKRKQ